MSDPIPTPRRDNWTTDNNSCLSGFRQWLQRHGYSQSAVHLYSVAARLALRVLDKPHWHIDIEPDLARVRAHIRAKYASTGTQSSYLKGIDKFDEYLRQKQGVAYAVRPINWSTYLDQLPVWLAEAVRGYVRSCERAWKPSHRRENSLALLSRCTRFIRWAVAHTQVNTARDLNAPAWLAYTDERLSAGIAHRTLNIDLWGVQRLLDWLNAEGVEIDQRLRDMPKLKEPERIPQDLSYQQLNQLLAALEAATQSDNQGERRLAIMDRAWVSLMAWSGLRKGEVSDLLLSHIDWARKQVRIEQGKGHKDRMVPIAQTTLNALRAWLDIRGPLEMSLPNVFLYRHKPLARTYCVFRLRHYGRLCGLACHPHQLRHTCATLLLNAGMNPLALKAMLGHKWLETTMGYARLYDATVAGDYFRAMQSVEHALRLLVHPPEAVLHGGEFIALLDSLHTCGPLNVQQLDLLAVLRASFLAIAVKLDPPAHAAEQGG